MHVSTELDVRRGRVPVRRTCRPRKDGFRKEVVVPDVLKTIETSGREVPINWNLVVFGFDVDGLMWHSEGANQRGWKHACWELARRRGKSISAKVQDAELVIDKVFDPNSGRGFDTLAPGLFDVLGAELGYDTMVELEEDLSEIRDTEVLRCADRGDFELLPGVRELLDDFRRRDFAFGLVTANGSSQVNALLKRFLGDEAERLLPHEHRLFGRELAREEGFRNKPDPQILKRLAAKFGRSVQWSLIIEDRLDMIVRSLEAGALGAILAHPDVADDMKLEKMQERLHKELRPRLAKRVILVPSLDRVRF